MMVTQSESLKAAIWHWAMTATERRINEVKHPQTMKQRRQLLRLEYEYTIYQRNYNDHQGSKEATQSNG